ncbi:MAG TPA: SRPBCC domain-containing protein [Actinomycetota bacterium]|nr:SRPBCC domain-containing protein [Actinomycetota bacterium]
MLGQAVTRAIGLRAAPEEVWAALTDAERLSEWFGVRAEIDPRPGGAVRFGGPGRAERRGLVEAADPPHRLVFRWRELHGATDGIVAGDASTVEFLLERDGEHTRLVVTESPGVLTASGADA